MTDLERELRDLLSDRSERVRPSSSVPPATLRKARIQRTLVGLGTCAVVVVLGVGGFLVTASADGAPEIEDSPARQIVASESQGDESWELSVSGNVDEICARLEVVRSDEPDVDVDETCAPEDEVLDARLTEVWDIPLAWGSVSSQVSEISTDRWGPSTLIGHEQPDFFDLPDEFGSERRLFLALDPNGIGTVAAKDSGGATLDSVAFGSLEPARIVSGSIENTHWSLEARPTADGICVTVEQRRGTKRGSTEHTNSLCEINGGELSLTQVSLEGVEPILVFGTVPFEAHRATLELESGRTERLPLRLRGGVRGNESYYVAVIGDATTEGAVVTLGRGGDELDRRALCSPSTPSMLNRRTINVPQFCGDGVD